tara:strand:- start:548 stop:697 length:150 start_codon:yes stop_codon:yes gene_type:complete
VKYEIAIIDRSYDAYCFLFGVSVHPKDANDDFLEINVHFLFLVLHIKIY